MKKWIKMFRLFLIETLLRDSWSQGELVKLSLSSDEALVAMQSDKVGRILLREFAGVLARQSHLVGKIERILQSMRVAPYLMIHSAVAKCLLLMERESKDQIEALLERGELETTYGVMFNNFLSNLGFEQSQRNSRIRELYGAEIFAGLNEVELPLGISNEASHHANHMDMMFVVAIARLRSARQIFEFGTYLGRTTCGLASSGEDVVVHTLNLPPSDDPRYGPYIGRLIKESPFRERIKEIHCDSRKFETGPFANRMDYIFIDADHSYDGVKNDSEKAFEMLALGGAIVWHDYAPKSPGVYRYLCELSRSRSLFRIRNTCLVVYLDGVDAQAFIPLKVATPLEDAE